MGRIEVIVIASNDGEGNVAIEGKEGEEVGDAVKFNSVVFVGRCSGWGSRGRRRCWGLERPSRRFVGRRYGIWWSLFIVVLYIKQECI